MITEIAHITIDPASAAEFEAAVARAVPAFRSAAGCRGMMLEREIEDPCRYRLVVTWDDVDAHLVGFRSSPGFQLWRDAAGPFFAAPPVVVHTTVVARHF